MSDNAKKSAIQQFTAIELEKGVLGSALIEPEAAEYVLNTMEEKMFHSPDHKKVFSLMERFYKKNNVVDAVAFSEFMKSSGIVQQKTDHLMQEMIGTASPYSRIPMHCQVLKEKFTHRQLYLLLYQLFKKVADPVQDIHAMIDVAQSAIKEFTETQVFHGLPNIVDQVADLYMFIDESQKETDAFRVKTGLSIDAKTGGVYNSDLLVIAARPSMGKTALMLTIVLNLLESKFERPIVVFSYEMTTRMLLLRLVCMKAGVSMEAVRRGKITPVDYKAIFNASSVLGFTVEVKDGKLIITPQRDCPLHVFDDTSITIERQVSLLHQIKTNDENPGLVLCDYMQMMPVDTQSGKNIGNREQEIAHISKNQKRVAKQFDIPYVSLSQLSRQVENRTSKRPQLSDLRESGSIEQDADAVLFLYRPEYYKIKELPEGGSTDGVAEIIIAKNRNGAVGNVYMHFEKQYARFSNLDMLVHRKKENRNSDRPPEKSGPPLPDYDEKEAPF